MRYPEKQVTSTEKINEILSACKCAHLGLNDNGRVYVVPLDFGFTENNGKYTFYMHGAPVGRKVELIKANGYGCIEMETNHELRRADQAWRHTSLFQSVIAEGKISFVTDLDEKKQALNVLMEHTSGNGNWEYPVEVLKGVCVFKLEAEALTCKENK